MVTRAEKPVRAPRPVANVTAALDLLEWIGHASDLGATTLYLRAGSPAAGRIDERIQPISQETVAASVIEDTTAAFTRGGDGAWEARADGEWVREDDELGYISCRVFSDQQGSGLILHLRPSTSLRLLHKHIPRQVRTACEGNGLVVVAEGVVALPASPPQSPTGVGATAAAIWFRCSDGVARMARSLVHSSASEPLPVRTRISPLPSDARHRKVRTFSW